MDQDHDSGLQFAQRTVMESVEPEKRLQRSELRYRRVFEAARDGILILDPLTRKITDVNQFMIELLGYPRDEFIGKELWEIGLLKDEQASREAFRELEERGYIRYEDLPLQSKAGTRREVEFVSNRYDEGGHSVIQCNIRDITERKRAERHIIDWKNRYDLVISASGQLVYDCNVSTGEIIWGGNLGRILGLTAQAMQGGFAQWATMIHPEDRVETLRLFELSRTSLTTFETEYRFLHSDGSYRWIHDRGDFLENVPGAATRMIGMMRDIDAHKLAEELNTLLAQTLKSVRDSVSITRLDDRILFVNEAFLTTYGYTSEELLGKPIDMVRAAGIPQQTLDELFRDTQLEGWHGEMLNRRKDGTEFPIELWTSTVTDSSGMPIATVGVARDITQRKKEEDNLRSSRAQLRKLATRLQTIREEEGTRIAREIHDELGQTLTGLKIDLLWLTKRTFREPAAVGGKLALMTERIDAAIRTLREISTALRPGVLQLGLPAAIEWQAKEFQASTGIRAVVEQNVAECAISELQSTNLFRMLQELLTNITRHAHATEVSISLSIENMTLLLEVRDNGRGIRNDELLKTKSLGILGMRERALLLGGDLAIEGAEGKGTTARVSIPLSRPPQEERAPT